jgi:hypothetical protein
VVRPEIANHQNPGPAPTPPTMWLVRRNLLSDIPSSGIFYVVDSSIGRFVSALVRADEFGSVELVGSEYSTLPI